ncbi:MAG: ABC transporter ATP-binding protein [Lachnospiraceae bacterium]|nr:ABC transporter ATP-binding protein [Lachnospiraceae bacterium]
MIMAIIEVQGLTKSYQDGEVKNEIFRNIDLCIEDEKFAAIIGKSGSGKSTLLNILSGLDSADAGEVIVGGKKIHLMKDKELSAYRSKDIGFVFQSFHLIPVLSVWENIILPIQFAGMSVDVKYVEELMEMLEITEKRNALPATLSGGQQQRVAIARALANKPFLVFADEPTGNLDTETGNKVFELLVNGIRRYHQTLVMVTHDMDIAKHADIVVKMEELKNMKRGYNEQGQ